jgi:hypothetical protein
MWYFTALWISNPTPLRLHQSPELQRRERLIRKGGGRLRLSLLVRIREG